MILGPHLNEKVRCGGVAGRQPSSAVVYWADVCVGKVWNHISHNTENLLLPATTKPDHTSHIVIPYASSHFLFLVVVRTGEDVWFPF